jgi:DtxR family Mn-dependent transcriptional regulator
VTRNALRAHENLSPVAAGYLKAIYELEEGGQRVATSALAERLAVAPACVTGMPQKLAENRPRQVDYERYHGVALTTAGRKSALQTVRRHRRIELYLALALGYERDAAAAEGERLEHVISDEFEDKISALLANRTAGPQRDPAPDPYAMLAVHGRSALRDDPGPSSLKFAPMPSAHCLYSS